MRLLCCVRYIYNIFGLYFLLSVTLAAQAGASTKTKEQPTHLERGGNTAVTLLHCRSAQYISSGREFCSKGTPYGVFLTS